MILKLYRTGQKRLEKPLSIPLCDNYKNTKNGDRCVSPEPVVVATIPIVNYTFDSGSCKNPCNTVYVQRANQ